jgi:hypothetical protein
MGPCGRPIDTVVLGGSICIAKFVDLPLIEKTVLFDACDAQESYGKRFVVRAIPPFHIGQSEARATPKYSIVDFQAFLLARPEFQRKRRRPQTHWFYVLRVFSVGFQAMLADPNAWKSSAIAPSHPHHPVCFGLTRCSPRIPWDPWVPIESTGTRGFHGYPAHGCHGYCGFHGYIPWVPMESIGADGFHRHPWIPWVPMDSMGTRGFHGHTWTPWVHVGYPHIGHSGGHVNPRIRASRA